MTEDDILKRTGATLIQIQRTERMIHNGVQYTLPEDDLSSYYADKKTRPSLGRLIAKLREHIQVDDSFDRTLDAFLTQRNVFVHEFAFLKGWTLLSPEGIAVAAAFLDNLDRLEREVDAVFYPFVKAWPNRNTATIG